MRYRGVYPVVIDDELFITANRMMDTLVRRRNHEDLLLNHEVVKKIFHYLKMVLELVR
jgi:hypothetical protein